MSLAQELMLRITGYTDKCSVRPGDDVSFHIHSELNESYDVQMVRLIHGEADGMPGVVCDRYAALAVLQLSSAGAERWRLGVAVALGVVVPFAVVSMLVRQYNHLVVPVAGIAALAIACRPPPQRRSTWHPGTSIGRSAASAAQRPMQGASLFA